MLANQNLLIETMQANHRHVATVLGLLNKACARLNLTDTVAECESVQATLRDTESMYATLHDASTTDLKELLGDVKKYAADVSAAQARDIQAESKKRSEAAEANVNDKFKKLESRVLSEIATGGAEADDPSAPRPRGGKAADTQLLRKMTNRLTDFESQVTSQLQIMSQDVEKRIAYLGSQPRSGIAGGDGHGLEGVVHDMDSVKYDLGELKDSLNNQKNDTAHVKRIVLACERDMEDFTAAMDAVNVDLDEMRARVDSTHSIITSRQRVEATVTAEISTMRLDMGDMQEALKAHDAWMEDVSQSLQEAHERCHQLGEDVAELRDQTQMKLDAKTDITAWNDMNDDIDASVKTVRDMTSALRLEVDTRRRKVDETFSQVRSDAKGMDERVELNRANTARAMEDQNHAVQRSFEEAQRHLMNLDGGLNNAKEGRESLGSRLDSHVNAIMTRMTRIEADLRKQDDDFHKEINDRVDGVERHHVNVSKETGKRMNALDLRISGLQGATGELKRDSNKLRDEVNGLTVKSAAHDVDIGKNADDLRKLETKRAEDNQRHKQDVDAIYEELDQKVYEKNFIGLEDNVTKLTRGTVKLCQVVGVFPGARMNDGTEEELDVDVELLNWEDCAQNLTGRVEKTWRQLSSQKYRSVLDLLSKKADHSVLRLLQISQQHIESQLDRVRHERELWKEVVDKRAQQPLQLALQLKDPHTGMPIAAGPPTMAHGMGMGMALSPGAFPAPRPPDGVPGDASRSPVSPTAPKRGAAARPSGGMHVGGLAAGGIPPATART